jgi:hypothetical protein
MSVLLTVCVDFVKALHANLLFCRGTVLSTQEVVVFALERSLWAPPVDAIDFAAAVHLLRKSVMAEVRCQVHISYEYV